MDHQQESTMEEHIQTDQNLELDEEQLQAITGGRASQSEEQIDAMKSVNEYMKRVAESLNGTDRAWNSIIASNKAKLVQREIRKHAAKGETFRVSKSWTKPLRRMK